MSEYTLAQFGTMDQAQADFQGTYSSLRSTMDDLDSQLRTNLSQWEGSAQEAYYAAKTKWDNAMADMQGVLNQLAGVIGTASDNYQQAEKANTALWT
jgi:6 kDa early secretory antigenic target